MSQVFADGCRAVVTINAVSADVDMIEVRG